MTDFTRASLAAKSELQIAWLVCWADPCTREHGIVNAWFTEEDAKIEAARLGDDHYVKGYPLKRAKSGPAVPLVTSSACFFRVTPTNETGFHSGRRRFLVECERCDVVVHESTTGVAECIEQHLRETERKQ